MSLQLRNTVAVNCLRERLCQIYLSLPKVGLCSLSSSSEIVNVEGLLRIQDEGWTPESLIYKSNFIFKNVFTFLYTGISVL